MQKTIYTQQHQRLCELLIEARKKADLTQAEVAERLGKPQSFVAKYEGGERRLDVVEFLEVARAIGVDPLATLTAVSQTRTSEGS
jgi:transcriptional regulator with XRE-family HTH domain